MARVLVVDDADLSAVVARFLESEGYVVECVVSAEDAYDLLTSRAFDLVLLDINLPGDSGFEACRVLRRVCSVPIIFASARTSETDRVEGLDTGGDEEVEGVRAENVYRIRVRDYGSGIAPEDIPFVFDRFYRGANKGDAPGAGLGLFIVRYLIGQMDGTVRLENAKPGLAVVIELPLTR